MKPLTNGQARVLYFLRDFYLTNDQLPPTHAIAAHFGWKSCNAAQEHLEGLAARGEYYWNPLISDSEALRLAVKLGLEIKFNEERAVVFYNRPAPWRTEEQLGLDRVAATRRAIVRAAAAIGSTT